MIKCARKWILLGVYKGAKYYWFSGFPEHSYILKYIFNGNLIILKNLTMKHFPGVLMHRIRWVTEATPPTASNTDKAAGARTLDPATAPAPITAAPP